MAPEWRRRAAALRTTTPGRLHNTRPAISVSKDVDAGGWDFPWPPSVLRPLWKRSHFRS